MISSRRGRAGCSARRGTKRFGKPGTAVAEVGAGVVVVPHLAQRARRRARGSRTAVRKRSDVEAGGDHEHVGLVRRRRGDDARARSISVIGSSTSVTFGRAASGTSRCPSASACRTAGRSGTTLRRAGRCGRRARRAMYCVKYSRWASLIAFSERSGCSHSGSFCSAGWSRSLNVQPSRTRYHERYSGTSRSSKRIGSGTGVRNCSNGAAQCGERWKIVSDADVVLRSRGPICIALAPLPITRDALAGEVEVVRPRARCAAAARRSGRGRGCPGTSAG